jgi:organic hydroperoxide reductase OsmC/OhrA
MLIAALSSCHMLWYLHLDFEVGIIVQSYAHAPLTTVETLSNGASQFLKATLEEVIKITKGPDLNSAGEMHQKCINTALLPVQ